MRLSFFCVIPSPSSREGILLGLSVCLLTADSQMHLALHLTHLPHVLEFYFHGTLRKPHANEVERNSGHVTSSVHHVFLCPDRLHAARRSTGSWQSITKSRPLEGGALCGRISNVYRTALPGGKPAKAVSGWASLTQKSEIWNVLK